MRAWGNYVRANTQSTLAALANLAGTFRMARATQCQRSGPPHMGYTHPQHSRALPQAGSRHAGSCCQSCRRCRYRSHCPTSRRRTRPCCCRPSLRWGHTPWCTQGHSSQARTRCSACHRCQCGTHMCHTGGSRVEPWDNGVRAHAAGRGWCDEETLTLPTLSMPWLVTHTPRLVQSALHSLAKLVATLMTPLPSSSTPPTRRSKSLSPE